MRSLTVTALALACSWSCQAADLGTRVPLAQREIAAHRTAKEAAACVAAQPLYWEIGNAERSLANGQSGEQAPGAQTRLALASASKWLYGAYVAEERQGKLSNEDVQFLSFQSGYTRFRVCLPNQTVGECRPACSMAAVASTPRPSACSTTTAATCRNTPR